MHVTWRLRLALACVSLETCFINSAAIAEGGAQAELALPQPDGPPTATCASVKASETSGTTINLHRSFLDDFSGSSLNLKTWQTHFEGVDNKIDNRTLSNNHEKEIYVDPAYSGSGLTPLGINPFKLKDGILSITADRTRAEFRSRLYDLPFTSGAITTIDSFKQTYGYFEIRAKVPRGKGLWPAFWLLQPKWQWPPEIDVLEIMNGSKPEDVLMTTHWKANGVGAHQQSYCRTTVSGDDNAFHLYGVLWTNSRIIYYIDRKPVIQLITPPGLDKPMYMLVNLAVQSSADETTTAPASFDIDWIVAYSE